MKPQHANGRQVPDTDTKIEQLKAATREANEALKDLHAATREARKVGSGAAARVEKDLTDFFVAALNDMRENLQQVGQREADNIIDKFNELKLLLLGKRKPPRDMPADLSAQLPPLDLEKAIAKAAAERASGILVEDATIAVCRTVAGGGLDDVLSQFLPASTGSDIEGVCQGCKKPVYVTPHAIRIHAEPTCVTCALPYIVNPATKVEFKDSR